MKTFMKCIVITALALAMTVTAVAAPAAAPAASAAADGRIQELYDPEKGIFYQKPFVEQTGEGWEPPVLDAEFGTWSQRFVYDGVAKSGGHYAGLAEPPYPYPNRMPRDATLTWIPEWGAWYVKHAKEEAYLDTIYSVGGSGSRVRGMDGKVADWCKPLPTAQAQKKQEAAK